MEECFTTLFKTRVPLKALLLLLTFALGSFTVSGTVLPLAISDAHRITGSILLTTSSSVVTVSQGMNASSTVTVLSIQGFAGSVALTSQAPSGIGVIFNPKGVNVPSGGTAMSMATLQVAKNASMGTYNVIVTGTGVAGRKVLSSSVLLTLTVNSQADFGVHANPYSIIVVAGFANSTSIVIDSKNGFDGSVSLSATEPFGFLGVMGGQNPVTLPPGSSASTSLQVSTTASTLPGKYNVTITGSSGSVSHSCILAVDVVDPTPESVTLLTFSLTSPTDLTLYLRNAGNAPTTLQSYSVSDLSKDAWILSSWTGPILSPGNVGPATILIGSSCSACIYNGVPLLFQQFLTGHTYLISVTTKLNSQFTFTIAT